VRQVSIAGVLVGAVVDIVSTNLLALPVAMYVMIANGILSLPKDQQQAAMMAALHSNFIVLATMTILGGACSVLGGHVAAWIAKRSRVLNGGLSSFLCVSFALYAIATGKTNEPLGLTVLLLPLSPALGAAGGYLRALTTRVPSTDRV